MKKIRICLALCLMMVGFGSIATAQTMQQALALDAIESRYAVLYNVQDQRILYDKEANKTMYPASMTKIMSVLVAFDSIADLDAKVTMEAQAFTGLVEANASVAGFQVGEVVTYRDLLMGALLPSGADACNQLALSLYGGNQQMVEAMNQKAQALGLQSTHFTNVTGLHEDDHYTTAYEMAKIVEAAIHNEELKKMLSTSSYTSSDGLLTMWGTLAKLKAELGLPTYHVIGGKTGFTNEAGNCLASFSLAAGETNIVVVANAPEVKTTTLVDSEHLYAYVEANYRRLTLIKAKEPLVEVEVAYASQDRYALSLAMDKSYLLPQSVEQADIEYAYTMEPSLEAPIQKGTVAGTLTLRYDGVPIDEIALTFSEDVERVAWKYYLAMLGHYVYVLRWFLLSGVFLLGVGGFYLRKRKR